MAAVAARRAAAAPAAAAAAPARGRARRCAPRCQAKKKKKSQVSEGAAYDQETRKTILSFGRVSKTASNGTPIIKDVSLSMYLGAKIGVLGVNGAGKSTLLRIMAGEDDAYEGDYFVDNNIKIGYLPQEPELNDGDTVLSNIEPAVKEIKQMLEDFEKVGLQMGDPDADMDALMSRMDDLQSKIDACNGWEVDNQLERAMDALRCPPPDAKVENLSGGERRRVAICRLLLSNPDVLLLDEPTNHLDAISVAWLERFLYEFRGTVVAITHDRSFLDNTCGWILEMDGGKGIPFEGNYSAWLESKQARLESGKQKQAALQKQIAEELEWSRSSAKGQQKKGKARVGRMEELEREAKSLAREASLDQITIPIGPRLGDIVVQAKGVTKGYDDRCLIEDLDLDVPPGAIVGIVGGNGAGKSTLFRCIIGEETVDAGELKVGETVVPMYVDQSREELDDELTVYEMLSDGIETLDIGGRDVSSRAYCSWFNFKGASQSKKVKDLSGGERNRLQLARALRNPGNLLMLDEPTNDLDTDTLRALEGAINGFSGSVLCVSHDRYFLDRVATHILAYEDDGSIVFREGNFSDYAADLRKRNGNADPTRVKYRKMPALS